MEVETAWKEIKQQKKGRKYEILKTIFDYFSDFLCWRDSAYAAAAADTCKHLWDFDSVYIA